MIKPLDSHWRLFGRRPDPRAEGASQVAMLIIKIGDKVSSPCGEEVDTRNCSVDSATYVGSPKETLALAIQIVTWRGDTPCNVWIAPQRRACPVQGILPAAPCSTGNQDDARTVGRQVSARQIAGEVPQDGALGRGSGRI